LVFTIKVLYLYCNNNHLKLIDMKLYTLSVNILDNDNAVFCSLPLTVTATFLSSAQVALKVQLVHLENIIDSSRYTICYNLNRLMISETLNFD
jgi:hypothetical protein